MAFSSFSFNFCRIFCLQPLSLWIQTQSVFGVHTINHDPLVPHLFRPTSSIYLTLNHFASSLQLSCDIHKHLCSEVQHVSQTIHVRTFFFLSLFSDRAHHVSNTVLNKTIPSTPDLQIDGTLKENCDILNPVILIENAAVPNYNYAYIPDFGRYYFVSPAENEGRVFWSIPMHVDVLYTWRAGIMSAPCIVAKSSSSYNLYLNDNNYKCYQNPHIFCQRFPSGFNVSQAKFIMTLFGDKVRAT